MPIKGLIFDAYGTLYDVHSVQAKTEELCPGKGDLITQVWRLKQLEYTWLQTLLQDYRDFTFLTQANGISFGGVIAFIFADLIVLPILDIYRKYYGLKMTAFLLATFYTAMAVAALIVEAVFAALGLIPTERQAQVVEASISWNYTTWLNIIFLILAALLVWRFMKTGGPGMLRMMNAPASQI